MGGTAVIAGVVPTPAVAYLTRTGGFDAGAVISASHNSFEFNGIKFFDADGYKLPDAMEDEIERLVRSDDVPNGTGRDIGTRVELDGAAQRYVDFACSTLGGLSLCGMRIVLDCANGASSGVAPAALRALGRMLRCCTIRRTGLTSTNAAVRRTCSHCAIVCGSGEIALASHLTVMRIACWRLMNRVIL